MSDRRHGHWEEVILIEDPTAKYITQWLRTRCSVCKMYHGKPFMYFVKPDAYCPSCGSIMDEEVKK